MPVTASNKNGANLDAGQKPKERDEWPREKAGQDFSLQVIRVNGGSVPALGKKSSHEMNSCVKQHNETIGNIIYDSKIRIAR